MRIETQPFINTITHGLWTETLTEEDDIFGLLYVDITTN
jgi:hypothetical protein